MTLRPIWLDYQRPRPGHTWPGVAILVLGIALTVSCYLQDRTISQDLDAAQKNVRLLKRQFEHARLLTESRTDEQKIDTPAIQNSRSAARWGGLFGALEAANDETVTLIGLTPQAHEISISGEAKNLDAALDYLKRLQASEALTNVRITEHEALKEHPQHPTRFTLTADWQGADR